MVGDGSLKFVTVAAMVVAVLPVCLMTSVRLGCDMTRFRCFCTATGFVNSDGTLLVMLAGVTYTAPAPMFEDVVVGCSCVFECVCTCG